MADTLIYSIRILDCKKYLEKLAETDKIKFNKN